MRSLNAKNLVVYHVSRFYIKKTETLLAYLCLCIHHPLHPVSQLISTLMPLISPCHRSPDNLLPSYHLLTYPKKLFDVCNQLYSLSLTN